MFGIPLLLIPVTIYAMIVFLTPGVEWNAKLPAVPLPSKIEWAPTFSDALIALALLMLMFEFIRSARPRAKGLMDHFLAIVLFGAAAAAFALLPQAANSTFAMLVLLCFVEMVSGIAASIRRPRPTYVEAVPAPVAPAAPVTRTEPPVVPRTEPAPTPANPVSANPAPANPAPANPAPANPASAPANPNEPPVRLEPSEKI